VHHHVKENTGRGDNISLIYNPYEINGDKYVDFIIISIISNVETYEKILGSTIEKLDGSYMFIPVDNNDNINFSSAASALNYGTTLTDYKCKYYIFLHQDVMFEDKKWLIKTKKMLDDTKDVGIAGCAGITIDGMPAGRLTAAWKSSQKIPMQKVQTLDELILVVPYDVFQKLKFDETTFTSWHTYGCDFAIAVTDLGLNAYTMRNPVYHHSPGSSSMDGTLHREQDKLIDKWKHKHDIIYATCGKLFKLYKKPIGKSRDIRLVHNRFGMRQKIRLGINHARKRRYRKVRRK